MKKTAPEKTLDDVVKEIQKTNKLLILLLRNADVKDNVIAKALDVTPGRLSQILPLRK